MFLERKFSSKRSEHGACEPPLCPVLPRAEWSALPELVYDVLCNIQLLLKARRGYDHIFPDFGLTPNEGHFGYEAMVERTQIEFPQTLARYEPRFTLDDSDIEVDDDGTYFSRATGTIRGIDGRFSFRFGVLSRKIDALEFVPTRER